MGIEWFSDPVRRPGSRWPEVRTMNPRSSRQREEWPLRPYRWLGIGFGFLLLVAWSSGDVRRPGEFYLAPCLLGALAGLASLTIRTRNLPVVVGFVVPLLASWYLRTTGSTMTNAEPAAWVGAYFALWHFVLGAGALLKVKSRGEPTIGVVSSGGGPIDRAR